MPFSASNRTTTTIYPLSLHDALPILERAGSVCIYYPLLYIQIVLAGISFKPLSCLAIWRTVLVKELGLAFILQPEHRACRSPATGELLAQFNKAVVLGVVPVGPVGSRAG